MITIPNSTLHEFKNMFEKYRLYVNSMNIYMNAIRMINGHHRYLNKEDFEKYYLNFTADIELVSSPIESFIPDYGEFEQNETKKRIFVVNRDVPEYERLNKRMNIEDLFNTLPVTHDVVTLLKDKPEKFVDIVDDVFIYWNVNKYLDMINLLRLKSISAMTGCIEYVVQNITLDQWKDFLSGTKKINEEKCDKYQTDNLFEPDYLSTIDYYKQIHMEFDAFDVEELIDRLCTNIIMKTDIYMIIAVYLILSFSRVDIDNNAFDDSPCATYVRDVLSKL